MAGVYFKGIYSRWTTLKSKGEGKGQILSSHIRILSEMPFPEKLERREMGRASQGSRETILQVLDCKKL